jgi:hypothetical protein
MAKMAIKIPGYMTYKETKFNMPLAMTTYQWGRGKYSSTYS